MRIYCKENAREARPSKGPSDSVAVYKCFPFGRPNNRDIHAHKFLRIEDAAKFLIDNPRSGIRVAAIGTRKGERTAILSETIVIQRDA